MFKKINYLVFYAALLFVNAIAMDARPLKFVAISNLLYDQTFIIPFDSLNTSISTIVPHMKIGSTTWIDAEQAQKLSDEMTQYSVQYKGPGGSAANTVVGLKHHGEEVGLIGSLANDGLGELYVKSLEEKKIQYRITPIDDHSPGSGNCTVLVTHENISERTMLTNLGVSGKVIISDEDLEWLSRAECLIVEGYLFQPECTYQTICKAAAKMKKNNKKVALTLSADFCVSNSLEEMMDYIQSYVDIIVGNENEMKELTQVDSPLKAAFILSDLGLTGAVTCGNSGAYVFNSTRIIFISCPSVTNVIDTTGAGDQFFAGFLYGLFNNKELGAAGHVGAYRAGQIVQLWGGQP